MKPNYHIAFAATISATHDKVKSFGPTSTFLVHPKNQKALVIVREDVEAIEVSKQRIEGQHTMNCIGMTHIDSSQPFVSCPVFSPGKPQKEREEFEDSLMSVYKLHSELSKNGYRLWESNVTFVSNAVVVSNTYIDPTELEDRYGVSYAKAISFEAVVVTTNLKQIMQTSDYPDLFWALVYDIDSGRILKAHRLDSVRNENDTTIWSEQLQTNVRRRSIAVDIKFGLNAMFDVVHVVKKVRTSTPGDVNTIESYTCIDINENEFLFHVVTNI